MATYNKPGVYIEESLMPNTAAPTAVSNSVAAFIGYADRGPTATVSGNVVGVPTLITNWNEFVNLFSYGSNINTFSGVTSVILSGASAATTTTTVTLSGSTTDRLKVGSVVTLLSGSGALQVSEPTIVTAVNSASSFTINAAPSVALSGATLSAAPNADLKYAIKSFFDNGGSQAYVVREVNPDAIKASIDIRDQNSSTALTGSLTYSTSAGFVTITATTGTPFANVSANKVVSFSGVPGNFSFLNGNDWVVSAVATNSQALTIAANSTATTATATTPITVIGGAQSATDALRISAKSAGAWGNGVWVGIYPSVSANYFDLHVYYDTVTDSVTDIANGDRIERFTSLSMDPTNDRYVVSAVNSNWIEIADLNPTGTGIHKLPEFTGGWNADAGSYNVDGTTREFVWNVSGFTSSPIAVKLGGASVVNNAVSSAVANGSDGATVRSAATIINQLDAISSPVLLNWAANSTTYDINALLTYASNRSDAFVIVDAANEVVATVLGSLSNKGILSYTGATNYGAAYYPYIVIPDPASTTGKTKSIAPGGAVAAIYSVTDTSRGVYKAPAGVDAIVRNAVSVSTITNDEFNLISNNSANLNVIRFVPGSGICVMGARTLSNQSIDRYVPVRRTLNYLGSGLKSLTEFAVFEPNDANLWVRVNGVVSTFLNDFWRRGGLAGATPDQAFYVKCDSSINTPNTISAGELHVEVGVALQKPAEFVIIRIGQLDGGATVTTSV